MNLSLPVGILVQVIAGIVITYIIYIIGLYVIRSDQIVNFKSMVPVEKTEVKILNGLLNSSEVAHNSAKNKFNTTIPFIKNYLPIIPSLNTQGGAQFSYSFWIYIGDPIQAAKGRKTIFIKGDKKRYNYTQTRNTNTVAKISEKKHDRAVFAPMLSFGGENLDLEIKFNTFHNMHETIHIRRIESENSLVRNNLQSLFSKIWFKITMVFEDNVPINDFERGILVRIYLNDTLYQMEKFASTLRQNRGDLILFPDGAIQDFKIADFNYYNYALPDEEVRKKFTSMPDIDRTASSTNRKTQERHTFETVAQNHLDIYNR